MNRLRAATVSVADCDAAVARYEQWLGYRTVECGRIGIALADAWHAPAAEGAAYAVMQPASGAPVYLRFVEGRPVPAYQPLRTFGWAALELCVQDVRAVHAALADGPFEIIGPPADNPGLPTIHPMQVQGPDGEVLYLTQILQGGEGSGLPTARSLVDALFIAVFATPDLAAASIWFKTRLGLQVVAPVDIPYRMLARAFALPSDQRHTITTASDDSGDICIELDQYPPAATTRPTVAGHLSPGMSICTIVQPGPLPTGVQWLQPPRRHTGIVYGGAFAGILSTPEGALVEVILRDDLAGDGEAGDDVVRERNRP